MSCPPQSMFHFPQQLSGGYWRRSAPIGGHLRPALLGDPAGGALMRGRTPVYPPHGQVANTEAWMSTLLELVLSLGAIPPGEFTTSTTYTPYCRRRRCYFRRRRRPTSPPPVVDYRIYVLRLPTSDRVQTARPQTQEDQGDGSVGPGSEYPAELPLAPGS